MASIFRGVLLPIQLFREHRSAKQLARETARSDFDVAHGVDTDGDTGGVTFLSDLEIPSRELDLWLQLPADRRGSNSARPRDSRNRI
jgi:hypothetical protein